MMMKKRSFTKEDKLQIIKEVSEQGDTNIFEKQGFFPATFNCLKKV
jgi:putative transposase